MYTERLKRTDSVTYLELISWLSMLDMKKYKDDSQLESDSLYRNQNIEKDYVAIGRFINKCFELKIN